MYYLFFRYLPPESVSSLSLSHALLPCSRNAHPGRAVSAVTRLNEGEGERERYIYIKRGKKKREGEGERKKRREIVERDERSERRIRQRRQKRKEAREEKTKR